MFISSKTWCRLRSHVYQGLEFLRSLCVMSSLNKSMCNSFVAKGDLMLQPLSRLLHKFRILKTKSIVYSIILRIIYFVTISTKVGWLLWCLQPKTFRLFYYHNPNSTSKQPQICSETGCLLEFKMKLLPTFIHFRSNFFFLTNGP